MPDYILTAEVKTDLASIYDFSLKTFGAQQAAVYITALHETFEMLALQPELGRSAERIRKGYRQYEHVSHSIYYTLRENGIAIIRVLHTSMDSPRHF